MTGKALRSDDALQNQRIDLLIEQWFGVDAGQVIPNAASFQRAALIG